MKVLSGDLVTTSLQGDIYEKRILSAALALTLLVSLNVQALATAPEEKVLLDSERFQDILNEYPDEFGYVEETYGVEITDYTAETSDLIKQAARDAYNTDRFDCLSQLAAELAVAKYEQSMLNHPSAIDINGVTRVVQPIDTTVIRSYGPIKGVVLDRIATGVTSSKTVGGSISVDSGELIGGFSISAEVSVEASMEATGPEEGARLANGAKVTHRIISGILFGVMVRTTYADIDPWTGAQLGDPYYEYTIIDEDGIAYSHLAHIASPTYVEKATDSSYVTDNNYQDFKEHLASYPGDFI